MHTRTSRRRGNADMIADFDPPDMGEALTRWYGDQEYHGKIKLVACSSGLPGDIVHRRPPQPYAQRLAGYLRRHSATDFKPQSSTASSASRGGMTAATRSR